MAEEFKGKNAKNPELLNSKKLFVLDMDGTFYLGERLIPGSLDFIRKLEQTGKGFLFFTNNSSKISSFYSQKLASMGCRVEDASIVTSGDVTIKYLQEKRPGKKIYLLGTELLRNSFTKSGIALDENSPDIVVIAFDTSLTYERISLACKYIRNGAEFIATHPDLNCPTEDGFIPDCGAMCAMITASTGVKPRYLGKPYGETIEMIRRITGMKNEDIVFVGDRLYTDIAIGVNHGVTSILVLSGETAPEDLKLSEIQPDFVFSSLAALGNIL